MNPKASSTSKLRIKWKEVCSEFKRECHLIKQSEEILGKHCRERWINHLDPNMKKFLFYSISFFSYFFSKIEVIGVLRKISNF